MDLETRKRKEKYVFFSNSFSIFISFIKSKVWISHLFTVKLCLCSCQYRSREVWAVDNNPTITITFKGVRVSTILHLIFILITFFESSQWVDFKSGKKNGGPCVRFCTNKGQRNENCKNLQKKPGMVNGYKRTQNFYNM